MSETVAISRPIYIDALNVAYWCGNPPSLRLPMALMIRLLAAGQQAFACFDASARYSLASEAGIYAQLIRYSRIAIEVPSGRSADETMLRRARSSGGCIVSKDRYRDYRRRFRKLIDDPARLMPGVVEHDRVRVPSLALDVPLPVSVHDAWAQLHALLTD